MRKLHVHRVQSIVDARHKLIPGVPVSCELDLERIIGGCAPAVELAISMDCQESGWATFDRVDALLPQLESNFPCHDPPREGGLEEETLYIV